MPPLDLSIGVTISARTFLVLIALGIMILALSYAAT